MKKKAPSPPFADHLPELRQFSFIMTGSEEVADAALEEALKTAFENVGTANDFPCYRSWLFAHLLEALKRSSSRTVVPCLEVCGWISLLQIPNEERAVFILVEGMGFNLATTALITGHPMRKLQRLLNTARIRFLELAPEYDHGQEGGSYLY